MYAGNADKITIESDERGFELHVDTDEGYFSFRIQDVAEEFYDHVKAAIGPWLYERDQARAEYVVAVREDGTYRVETDEDTYDPSDPKHPRYHSTHADVWDNRDKTQ